MAADDEDELEAHLARAEDAEALLRERRARVRICAWCESVCVDGEWYPATHLMTVAWRLDPRASHTICPRCFDELLPGETYPSV